MSRQVSPGQRYRAVLAVLSGAPVAEVARRNGVSRQTLHNWRRRYGAAGVAGLADRSRRPHRSPARLAPAVEELICALREQHPGWGAQRLQAALGGRSGVAPSRTTVHRVLVRNNLVAVGDRAAGGGPASTDGPLPAMPAGQPEQPDRPDGLLLLADLLDAARALVDRLDRALAALAVDAEHGCVSPEGCGLCEPGPLEPLGPLLPGQPRPAGARPPTASLFEQPRTPASTMYRHGAVVPSAAESARPATQLTEKLPTGRQRRAAPAIVRPQSVRPTRC